MARRPTARSGLTLNQLSASLRELRDGRSLPPATRRRLAALAENVERLLEAAATGRDAQTLDTHFDRQALQPADLSEPVSTIALQPDLPPTIALDRITSAAIETIRKRTPEALPSAPLAIGARGADLPITSAALSRLLQLAAVARSHDSDSVVWDDGVNQLIVHASQLKATSSVGQIRVAIPVAADSLRTTMRIPFAVGSRERMAGLVTATLQRPAGDAVVSRIWGDALIALAYGALMDVIASLAGASGRDVKNDRLIPRALVAGRGQLTIESQARFRFKGQTK